MYFWASYTSGTSETQKYNKLFHGLKLLFIVWVLEADSGLFKNWEHIRARKNSNNNFELISLCNDCHVPVNIWSFNNHPPEDISTVKVKRFCPNSLSVLCFPYGHEASLGGPQLPRWWCLIMLKSVQ